MGERLEIHIVSDSTGDTGARVARAAQSQFVDTEIEMSFMLPLVDTGSWIVCRGRIVRTVPPHEQQVPSALGAAFTSYRFVRGRNAAA